MQGVHRLHDVRASDFMSQENLSPAPIGGAAHWIFLALFLQKNMAEKTTIKMMPDTSCSLFWQEDGTCCGDAENLSYGGERNTETNVNLNIPGLREWLDEYMWRCLVPREAGEITPDELSRTFGWKDFHKRGLALAAQVKKLLSPNVELLYCKPYEDASGIINGGGVVV